MAATGDPGSELVFSLNCMVVSLGVEPQTVTFVFNLIGFSSPLFFLLLSGLYFFIKYKIRVWREPHCYEEQWLEILQTDAADKLMKSQHVSLFLSRVCVFFRMITIYLLPTDPTTVVKSFFPFLRYFLSYATFSEVWQLLSDW